MAQEEEAAVRVIPLSSATPTMVATRWWPAEQSSRLVNLPTDVLSKLHEHVILPFVLKLVCRALREA